MPLSIEDCRSLVAGGMGRVDDLIRRRLTSDVVLINQLSAYIIGHAIEAWSNPAALLIPAAIGADFYQYMNADSPTPDTEIILTTRVKQDARLVYSHSSIYYLRTADAGLYQGGGAIKVRGPVVL